MTLPKFPGQLFPYHLMRWRCIYHGYFETGTAHPLTGAQCPNCGDSAEVVDMCTGHTQRDLPFVSRPREHASPGAKFQIKDDRGVIGAARIDATMHRRKTGRPRKIHMPEGRE